MQTAISAMHKHADKMILKPYRTRIDGWTTPSICLLLGFWICTLAGSMIWTYDASMLL